MIWVNQFTQIINSNLEKVNLESVTINDIGCNVGHFARNIEKINKRVNYRGIDISKTYLDIAKKNFLNLNFIIDDFSRKDLIRSDFEADITVVSATLEHIEEYFVFLENIFATTSKNVIIRTFLGDETKVQYCRKEAASNEYLIRQFQIDDIVNKSFNKNWSYEIIKDQATNSENKKICENIFRTQFVVNFLNQNSKGVK